MKNYFVTGIGTGVGKTIVSAVLVEKLQADYWKPVQSGDLDDTDTEKVKRLVSVPPGNFHLETYRLTQPFSPHKSAALDGITINLKRFILPETSRTLIIEGAGGLMVPLNNHDLMTDLIKKLQAVVILVSRHYLGSINHTLLSVELLRQKNIPCSGLIFSGKQDEHAEAAIKEIGRVDVLGRVPELAAIDRENIRKAALSFTF